MEIVLPETDKKKTILKIYLEMELIGGKLFDRTKRIWWDLPKKSKPKEQLITEFKDGMEI